MSGPTTHPNLEFYVGDTILIDVQITDARGNVLQLTDVLIRWVMMDAQGANVATCEIGSGIEVVDVNGGKIEISKSADLLAPGFYQDQLRLKTLADGYVVTQMIGIIEIKPSLKGAEPW